MRPTITIAGVSKVYPLRGRRTWLLQEVIKTVTRGRPPRRQLWALKDVTVDIQPGESLGVVGGNGAGKSTLLKIIAGITRPTAGRVQVVGRVSTQLGLGLGFNPNLTGRENIFLEGTILGLTNAEVRRRLDRIIDYAGVEGAIDQPMWTYSSGMISRLGFAVAAHTEFDILLLDEALSAGDARFRERCDETLLGFKAQGKTLVTVSHGMESIRKLADRAIWLEKGVIREEGPAIELVDAYESAMTGITVVTDTPRPIPVAPARR
ncbi:MAG: ABC transporter ATP-binding protein [Candidatus Limnocylindrales bacterium]